MQRHKTAAKKAVHQQRCNVGLLSGLAIRNGALSVTYATDYAYVHRGWAIPIAGRLPSTRQDVWIQLHQTAIGPTRMQLVRIESREPPQQAILQNCCPARFVVPVLGLLRQNSLQMGRNGSKQLNRTGPVEPNRNSRTECTESKRRNRTGPV